MLLNSVPKNSLALQATNFKRNVLGRVAQAFDLAGIYQHSACPVPSRFLRRAGVGNAGATRV